MLSTNRMNRRAFSLIELVIVVVIIGIIAAIAIPRMSRGASGANDSALSGNLAVLRKAIDLYQAEHDGAFPTSATTIADQLTKRTNAAGGVQPTPGTDDNLYPFGPYLRAIPPLSVGANKGQNGFHSGAVGSGSFGWHYTPSTGTVVANTAATEVDSTGKAYNTY